MDATFHRFSRVSIKFFFTLEKLWKSFIKNISRLTLENSSKVILFFNLQCQALRLLLKLL